MHRGGMAKWANKGWLVLGTSGGQCWAEGQGRGGVGAHGDGEQQGVLEDRCSRLQGDRHERRLRARKKKTMTKKKPLGKGPSRGVKGCISISLIKMIPTHDH